MERTGTPVPLQGLVFLSAFMEFHHRQGARVADLLAQGQLVHGRNMGAGGGAQGVRVGAVFSASMDLTCCHRREFTVGCVHQ